MQKTISIILLVVAIASLLLTVVTSNAELWGISPQVILTISSVILAIKEFVQGLSALTAQEAADFANQNRLQAKGPTHDYTAADVKRWKNQR